MNLFSDRITGQYLIAECWIPENKLDDVRLALIKGQTITNSTLPSILNILETDKTPPTYNKTNKLTAGFQNIINSYGISTYGEINPSPFCIVTFPFIFALMFADMGHGIIMFLFALWMVIKEKRLKFYGGEVFQLFFAGRYIILLMGLFSIYTGLIYNDMFSKSVNLFGTSFRKDLNNFNRSIIHLEPSKHLQEYRYSVGIDPIWQLSHNKVQYLNTYKMKLSVIIGVSQMLFGVILSLFNHIYHRKIINIIGEFIPQVIFLLAIFGYMNFMIFFKWLIYTDKESARAPSILITMINMFMFKMPAENDPAYLKEEMFQGQFLLQKILIILALICVPIMLLTKPLFLLCKNKQKKKNDAKNGHEDKAMELGELNDPESNSDLNSSNSLSIAKQNECMDKQFNFGDIFINQTIHTIEYCLGSISHTASYLRLWALSLAHTQLSEVLWSMVLRSGFGKLLFFALQYTF